MNRKLSFIKSLEIQQNFRIQNFIFGLLFLLTACNPQQTETRERISLNRDWQFFKYTSDSLADQLIYDVRPAINEGNLVKDADSKPTEAVEVESTQKVLKDWILPTANDFINDSNNKHQRPDGNPGSDFPFVKAGFDDASWETVNLPHDWAIKGPFQTGWNSEVGGGMGRLPVNGVAWYRKKLDIPETDKDKRIFLDIDGAMSYAMVWLNGNLVGGWPYGYASFRLDLTPYIVPCAENQLAIRLDNPNYSARWYPGAGLYRNVWLVKTNPVHVAQYGTYITCENVSEKSATINLEVTIDNDSESDANVEVLTELFELKEAGKRAEEATAVFESQISEVKSGKSSEFKSSIVVENPKLWGPPPTQQPNLYVAVTTVFQDGKPIDSYETRFGIRSLEFDPEKGVLVNGELIKLQGVNNHHDLGALGAAFNKRAAERQLEILRKMGCNAIRTAHNPPAPELLELTDKMGFLVLDEIFDSWERKKTDHDFHLIFEEWSEPDTRAFIRRDRNCPSVIIWSFGNEVGEQYTEADGAAVARRLYDFVKEEDRIRPTITAMNFAKPLMKMPEVADFIGLNYQGEGIRQDPMFEGTERIQTVPMYDAFHEKYPEKVIISTETASAFSSRGIYFFPVTDKLSSPVRDGMGGDSEQMQVSSYELYAVDFGSSVDKVFAAVDSHPFVAGEFVWNGFDYIGEPTPYYGARSSYSGIIDLAGIPKDRYYLYQSKWRPELPMVHILPHWNWPERVGKTTPVHIFTSGDEVELFLNGKSLGKKKKGELTYRLRWDDVVYEPGELKAVAWKKGEKWAEQIITTSGKANSLQAVADRKVINADGNDLSYITVRMVDENQNFVPKANNQVEFSIEGPGNIIASDNGDATDMTSFTSLKRNAFSGVVVAIVQTTDEAGTITVTAKADGLKPAEIQIESIK
ncbi:beta-galactosidase GalB [Draconibacterium sp. IB214405]|uniref:beta-galactosidase GalB n=1 Tax=Draconibacterium sp. IB214405 TaxID=3097352 RepID=UPI002A181B5F|nr:beta-galactosidase GalB [Draconibacterium sp. IB214405]MDX8339595.1 beta-galactosidase GalB [Draconibacterium sp. IB214405]